MSGLMLREIRRRGAIRCSARYSFSATAKVSTGALGQSVLGMMDGWTTDE